MGTERKKKIQEIGTRPKINTMTYVLRQQTTTGWPYAEGEESTSQQGLHRRRVMGGIPGHTRGGRKERPSGWHTIKDRCRRVIYEAMRPFKTAKNMSPEREESPEELQAHED